jgi:hypothetical protein
MHAMQEQSWPIAADEAAWVMATWGTWVVPCWRWWAMLFEFAATLVYKWRSLLAMHRFEVVLAVPILAMQLELVTVSFVAF